MAKTAMPSTSALAIKLWSLDGFVDVYKKSCFGHMMNRGVITIAEELDRAKAGSEMTFNYTGILTGVGITEGGTMVGNEEGLDNQAFSMKWNVVRNAVLNPNEDTIEQTRTNINFYNRARTLLQGWHKSRLDASVFNQLAGVNSTTVTVDSTVYSGADRTIVQGLNDVNAPTSNRIIRAGGAATDQALTSSDTMTLDLIDAAIEQASSTYPHLEPLDGDEFDLYLSFEQLTDLKRDTSGAIKWYDIYRSALEGGMKDGNPLMNANQYSIKPVGRYANVNIYSAYRVARGVNSATSAALPDVARAVLVGKDAAAFASKFSGSLSDDNNSGTGGNVPLKYTTELQDYDYLKGIEARMLYGVKKLQFDNEDLGCVVISTYAAGHTS